MFESLRFCCICFTAYYDVKIDLLILTVVPFIYNGSEKISRTPKHTAMAEYDDIMTAI